MAQKNKYIKMESKLFLKKIKFLPLSKWHNFKLNHKKANERAKNTIRKEVGDKNGLYIYKKCVRILYIGKAKSLSGRLTSHYYESYKGVGNDIKGRDWYKFFSSNKGVIEIFWKEVKNEYERQALEKILEYVLESEFEKIRGKHN